MKILRWVLPVLVLGLLACSAHADGVSCITVASFSTCVNAPNSSFGPNTWVLPNATNESETVQEFAIVVGFGPALTTTGVYDIFDASGTVSDQIMTANIEGNGFVLLFSDPSEDISPTLPATTGCTETSTGCHFSFTVSTVDGHSYIVTVGSDGDGESAFDFFGYGTGTSDGISVAAVTPEPSTMYLLSFGLFALLPLKKKLGNQIQS